MELKLTEDVRGIRRAITVFTIVVILLLLFGGALQVTKGTSLVPVVIFGCVGGCAAACISRLYRKRKRAQWLVGDEGVVRISDDVEELIRWSDIQFVAKDKGSIHIHWVFRSANGPPCEFQVRLRGSEREIVAAFEEIKGRATIRRSEVNPKRHIGSPRRVMGYLTAIGGCILLIATGASIFQKWPSVRWPTVEGRIIEVHSHKARSKYDMVESRVSYEYFVNKVRFMSNRYSLWAQDILEEIPNAEQNPQSQKYRSGDNVRVFYDPANPSFAVIAPGIQWILTILQLLLGVSLLVLAVRLQYVNKSILNRPR